MEARVTVLTGSERGRLSGAMHTGLRPMVTMFLAFSQEDSVAAPEGLCPCGRTAVRT